MDGTKNTHRPILSPRVLPRPLLAGQSASRLTKMRGRKWLLTFATPAARAAAEVPLPFISVAPTNIRPLKDCPTGNV